MGFITTFSTYLLAICTSPFLKCQLNSFAHLLLGLFVLLVCSF
jgi:hypothetical protein